MSEYLSFEGSIEPLEWGRSVYTILRVPGDIAEMLAAQGAKRVEGEINDQPMNMALSRAPAVEGVFLWTGKSVMRQLGTQPGELLEVRLRKAPEDYVEVPEDVMAALREAELVEVWEAITPGKRRGLLYSVNSAKRAATRASRIAKLLERLPE